MANIVKVEILAKKTFLHQNKKGKKLDIKYIKQLNI